MPTTGPLRFAAVRSEALPVPLRAQLVDNRPLVFGPRETEAHTELQDGAASSKRLFSAQAERSSHSPATLKAGCPVWAFTPLISLARQAHYSPATTRMGGDGMA